MSSLLQQYMHHVFGRPDLHFDANGRPTPTAAGHPPPMLGAFVACYMDDIIVFSKTRAEHEHYVWMVLATLCHHQLFANCAKCAFCSEEVAFLGHILSAEGLSADPQKIHAVQEWPSPASCANVRRFLGLATYYCSMVDRFSSWLHRFQRSLAPARCFTGGAGAGELQLPQVSPLRGSGPPAVGSGAPDKADH